MPLQIFQSFLDHRPHPSLRFLTSPHQLLARKQFVDLAYAHFLNDIVPTLLSVLSQHADQSQQKELILYYRFMIIFLAESLFLE